MNANTELTNEEEIFYANQAGIEMCDDIGHNDWVPLQKDIEYGCHNYMIFDGKFICRDCRI
mgnify:CR=1 FL=1